MNQIGKEQKIIDKHKIIYGTARFGNPDYGSSKNPVSSSEEIINNILRLGIRRIDTANIYGTAEKLIGKYSNSLPKEFLIDTKVTDLNIFSKKLYNDLKTKVNISLDLMKVNKINTLYLHQNDISLISDPNIIESLIKLKEELPVTKIGVSIYSLKELEYCINQDVYETIQIPVNLISRSFYNFLNPDILKKKEIIVRSIFLQGFLAKSRFKDEKIKNLKLCNSLINSSKICRKFGSSLINESKRYIDETGLKFIIGSASNRNISNSLKYFKNENSNQIEKNIKPFLDNNFEFTNPRNWN